jgi:hypothetical protein
LSFNKRKDVGDTLVCLGGRESRLLDTKPASDSSVTPTWSLWQYYNSVNCTSTYSGVLETSKVLSRIHGGTQRTRLAHWRRSKRAKRSYNEETNSQLLRLRQRLICFFSLLVYGSMYTRVYILLHSVHIHTIIYTYTYSYIHTHV